MNGGRNNLLGVGVLTASSAFFVANDTLIKLASARLPISEILFVRGLCAWMLLTVAIIATGTWRAVPHLLQRSVAWRMVGEWFSTLTYLIALFRIPIGTAYVIQQAMPLAVTAAAAAFLGERVGWRRWTAIAVGFLGVLLVVRPGLGSFNPFALLVLVSVAFMVVRDFAARAIPAAIPALAVAWAMALGVAGMGAVIGLTEHWMWPTAAEFGQLAGAALLLALGYVTVIEAMRLGELSATAAFRYTAIVFAVVAGYLVWNDVPDLPTAIGAAVIVATGIYTFHRERLAGRGPAGESVEPV